MRQIMILGLCLLLASCTHRPPQAVNNDLIVPPEIDLLPGSDNFK